jgi:hypothetical protein
VSGDLSFAIAGRAIGPGHPPFIVAELSGNHRGDLSRALALIDPAKLAGADAVKLQTYTADTMTLDCDRSVFRIRRGPLAWPAPVRALCGGLDPMGMARRLIRPLPGARAARLFDAFRCNGRPLPRGIRSAGL